MKRIAINMSAIVLVAWSLKLNRQASEFKILNRSLEILNVSQVLVRQSENLAWFEKSERLADSFEHSEVVTKEPESIFLPRPEAENFWLYDAVFLIGKQENSFVWNKNLKRDLYSS